MASPAKMRPKSQEAYNGNDNVDEEEVDSAGVNTEEFHVMRMEPRPFRPFKTSEEYLYAMKEDLAEWLNTLYNQNITVDNFFEKLETGVIVCQYANNVIRLAQELKLTRKLSIPIPDRDVVYKTDVHPGTFKARDNISNFITWCRAINIKECLLFETDDLVMRKNERSFILCLLEVARIGARYGMPAPVLVQMEQEIDAEIEEEDTEGEGHVDSDYARETVMTRSYQTQEQRMAQLMGLHERVVNLLNGCTCPSQFPMIKVSDGKYRIGDTRVLIFVRILRNHVMVRVGGGWDTLEHYLDKHDPCRCRSGHRFSTSAKLNMSVGKGGSPSMQVTYNRPTQHEPSYRSPSTSVTNFAMEHAVETIDDGFKNGSNMEYAINPGGRKSHDFSAQNYNAYQFASARKPRSKSFDNASNYLMQEENAYVSPNSLSRKLPTPKGVRKENSDPSCGADQSFGSPDRSGSLRKSPLLPSCPNKIPLQKSASKSKIPCLEPPLQKSPKSQSTEDLFRTKYYLGADDRWMRSRSSSSSPVHGTPRSASMEQCSLSALSALHKSPSRRSSQHEESNQFLRTRPGQYSFRMTKKSPELRRKNDAVNKTWSFHNKGQRPPLHSEWTGSPSRQTKQSPLASQQSQLNSSKIGRVTGTPKTPTSRPSSAGMRSSELDADEKNSTELLNNIKQLIDQCESKYDQQEDYSFENHNGTYTNQNGGVNGRETSISPENGVSKSNGTSAGSQRNRLNRESPTGSVSRIPVPQWK